MQRLFHKRGPDVDRAGAVCQAPIPYPPAHPPAHPPTDHPTPPHPRGKTRATVAMHPPERLGKHRSKIRGKRTDACRDVCTELVGNKSILLLTKAVCLGLKQGACARGGGGGC